MDPIRAFCLGLFLGVVVGQLGPYLWELLKDW